ncbi:hypothetical protein H5410_021415 [Solanum commersonii]|uniref:Uncharacterized protein n=1 Tax=Solanum commersonii TaxID=4109 RepID=A0A9J5ZH52_SOLCO|nr:hypothetical protein H5410_021415 [Solanum commersonii]
MSSNSNRNKTLVGFFYEFGGILLVSLGNHQQRVFSSSSGSHARTLVTLTTAGKCTSFIFESLKNELDPNGINWKGVSNDIRDGHFGEFKKYFYWDSSINEGVVRTQWEVKAATRDAKNVERSEINSRNRCAGREVAPGTHTGVSLSIGEYRKKLASIYFTNFLRNWTAEKGRDPTPSELHLHVHTHGHDGKSFVGERSRIVHVNETQKCVGFVHGDDSCSNVFSVSNSIQSISNASSKSKYEASLEKNKESLERVKVMYKMTGSRTKSRQAIDLV